MSIAASAQRVIRIVPSAALLSAHQMRRALNTPQQQHVTAAHSERRTIDMTRDGSAHAMTTGYHYTY